MLSARGQGLRWLGVIYLERGLRPKALLRYPVSDTESRLWFLAGVTPERLSETMTQIFDELANQQGLSTVQISYPRGITETEFIEGLREAKRLREIQRPFLEN